MLRPQPRQGSLSGLLTSPDPVENARMNMPAEPARYGATLTNRTPDAVDGVRPMFGLPGEPLVTPERNRRDSIMAEMLTGASGGIRAFHGSPHNFDRFRTSSIGTGEGAQAYGHGLYFAGDEAVARSYRDALRFPGNGIPGSAMTIPQRILDDLNYHRGNQDPVRRNYEAMAKGNNPDAAAIGRDALAQIDGVISAHPGRMYEVNLNADPARMLDFDAPFERQAAPVRDAMGSVFGRENLDGAGPKSVGSRLGSLTYNRFGGIGNDAAASSAMSEAGIPGIRYLDGGSRGAGQGSSNYVMFNDDQIEIIRKYGIAGLGMGLGAANAPYSDPAQGDTQ